MAKAMLVRDKAEADLIRKMARTRSTKSTQSLMDGGRQGRATYIVIPDEPISPATVDDSGTFLSIGTATVYFADLEENGPQNPATPTPITLNIRGGQSDPLQAFIANISLTQSLDVGTPYFAIRDAFGLLVVDPGGGGSLLWAAVAEDKTSWDETEPTEEVPDPDPILTTVACYHVRHGLEDYPDGTPDPIDVILPRIDGATPNLHQGDVIVVSTIPVIVPDSDPLEFQTGYAAVSNYTKAGANPVYVKINTDPDMFSSPEDDPESPTESWPPYNGVVVSGTAYSTPDATGDSVADPVDVLLLRCGNHSPTCKSGDILACLPYDESATTPRYVAVSDYSSSDNFVGIATSEITACGVGDLTSGSPPTIGSGTVDLYRVVSGALVLYLSDVTVLNFYTGVDAVIDDGSVIPSISKCGDTYKVDNARCP